MRSLTTVLEGLLDNPDSIIDDFTNGTVKEYIYNYIGSYDFTVDVNKKIIKSKQPLILIPKSDEFGKIFIIGCLHDSKNAVRPLKELINAGYTFDMDLSLEMDGLILRRDVSELFGKLSDYHFVGRNHTIFINNSSAAITLDRCMFLEVFLDDVKHFSTLNFENRLKCSINKCLDHLKIKNIILSFDPNIKSDDLGIEGMNCDNLIIQNCNRLISWFKHPTFDTTMKDIIDVINDLSHTEQDEEMMDSFYYKNVVRTYEMFKDWIKNNPKSKIIVSFVSDYDPFVLTLDKDNNILYKKSRKLN